jgi:hypothetical protein
MEIRNRLVLMKSKLLGAAAFKVNMASQDIGAYEKRMMNICGESKLKLIFLSYFLT